MSCLWCEGDENEIQTFLKILSKEVVTDSNEAYLTCADECLPDLFFCLECVKVYHSSKNKFINKEESKKELVIVEHNRLIDHMQKVEKKIAEAGNSPEMTYLIPFVEILIYPYLCLNSTVMKLFINGLEWMIDFMSEEILEQESSYKTWFLLTICSNDKIKEWATDCIGNMNMIDNENFFKFKPIFSSILRILLKDETDFQIVQDVETEIYYDTKLPDHIYMGRTNNEIWIACGVIFNSLESTVLKELLTFNKNEKILTLLFKGFFDSSVNIWIFLYVLEILLEKLGSLFWFLPSTSDYSPMQLFDDIKNHKDFLMINEKLKDTLYFAEELKYSRYSQVVYSWNKGINDKDGSMHASRLFSWILPLLKAVTDFHSDAENFLGCIFHYLMNIMDKSIVSSRLHQIVRKSIIDILSFISNLNIIWLLIPLVDPITDLLLKLSVPVIPGDLSVATAAISLVNMLVAKAYSKKQITNDLSLSFHSNYKKMQMKQPFDETVLKKILHTVLQYLAQIKAEPFIKKDNFDSFLKEAGASIEEPIIVNDVDDVYGDNAGPMELNVDLNTENFSPTKPYAIGLSMLGSHSPILISDDEEEAPDIDIQDSGLEPLKSHNDTVSLNKNQKELLPLSQKNIFEELTSNLSVSKSNQAIFKNCVTSNFNDISLTSIEKSDSKESKLISGVAQGSKNDIFESHNKNLDEQSKNDKFLTKQSEENQDKDMSDFVDKCFDISSNFNEPLLSKKAVPKPSSSTLMQRSSTLRREKIEQEISTKSKPLKLPNLDSKPFTISDFHKSILDWKVEWLENHMEPVCNCLKNVGTNFESYDEYSLTFWSLVLCEAHSLVKKEWDEKSNSSQIYTVIEIDVPKTTVTSFRMKCEYKSKGTSVCCPAEEDLVLLKFDNESQSVKVFGIVEKVVINYSLENDSRVSTCILKVKLGELANSKTYKHVSVTKILSLTTVFRQITGLIAFKNSLLASDILKPFRTKTYNYKEKLLSKKKSKRLVKLNSAQLQAVSTVFHAVCQTEYVIPRIILLQGPPGTGKSYTIKTIITHLMQEFYKSSIASKQSIKSQHMRILFCAPSNAAVDEIVRRLVCSPPWRDDNDNHSTRHGNCGDFNIIRVGYKSQVASDLESYSLEYLLANELKKYKLANNAYAIKEQLKSLKSKLNVLDIECVKLKMSTDQSLTEQYIMKTEERSRVQQSVDELNSKLNSLSEKQIDFQEEEFNLQRSLLLRADIVCTTLSGAGSKPMIDAFKRSQLKYAKTPFKLYLQTTIQLLSSRDVPFRCVIIDEAGQCTEPDALIPLQYGSSKLLLVGDPAQLSATVLSQRASRFNFGQSLFERLFKGFIINTETKERPAILLDYQYRMAPDICLFPNQRFYNNELKSFDTLKNKVPGLKNYVLINLDKGREDKTKTGSIHNPLERDHIIAICKKLVITKTANAYDIAVITPYRQQATLLRQELKKPLELEHIDVDTIDGFQGREKRIVILSCVRGASQQGTIGFLSNPQRMNVALTRAKDALIIIAKCSSIEIDEDWKALVDNARERGLLFNVQNCNDTLKCIFENPDVIQQPTEFLNEEKAKSKVSTNIIASNLSGKHSYMNCLQNPVESTHFNVMPNPIENSKQSDLDSKTTNEKKDLKNGPINQPSIYEIHPNKLVSSFQANQTQVDQTPLEKKKNNDLLTVKDESLVKEINILNDKPNIESFEMFIGSELSSNVSHFERDNKIEVTEASLIAGSNEEAKESSDKKIFENNIVGQSLPNLQVHELMPVSDSGNAEKQHLIDGNVNVNFKNEVVNFPMKSSLENHNIGSTLHALKDSETKTFDKIDTSERNLKKAKDNDTLNECKKLKKKRKKTKKNKNSNVEKQASSDIPAEQSEKLINVKLLKKQLKANPVMKQKVIDVVIDLLENKEKNSSPKSNSSSYLDLESPTYSTISIDSDCALEIEPNPSVVEKMTQPTFIGSDSGGIQDFRRSKPTLSYYKVPHHHSDGTYCQKVCKRVLERERKKQFFADDELLRISTPNKACKWELIPLEITTGHCYSAQKANTSPHFISEDPRLRSTVLPGNMGSLMEKNNPNNASQNILSLKNLSQNLVYSDTPDDSLVKDIAKDGSNPPNITDNRLVKICNDSPLFELNLNLKNNVTLKNSQIYFQNERTAPKDLSIRKKMKKNPQHLNLAVDLPQPPLPSETEIRPPSPKDDSLPQISIFDEDRSSPMDICDDLKSPIIIDLPVSKSHSTTNLGLYQSTPQFNDSSFSYTYAFNNQFLYRPNLVFQSQTFSDPIMTPKSPAPLSTFYLGNDMRNYQLQEGTQKSCFVDSNLLREVEKMKAVKENESFSDTYRTFQTSPTTPPQKKIAYIAPQPVELQNQQCEKSFPCTSENFDKLQNYDKLTGSSTSFDNSKAIDINEQALNLLNIHSELFEESVQRIIGSNICKENQQYIVNYLKGFLAALLENQLKNVAEAKTENISNLRSPILDLSSDSFKSYFANELQKSQIINKSCPGSNCEHDQPIVQNLKGFNLSYDSSENMLPNVIKNENKVIGSPTIKETIPSILDESRSSDLSNNDVIQRRIQRFGLVQKNDSDNCIDVNPPKTRLVCSPTLEYEKSLNRNIDKPSEPKFYNSSYECRVIIDDIKDIRGKKHDFILKKEGILMEESQKNFMRKVGRAKMVRTSNPKAVVKINSRQFKCSTENNSRSYAKVAKKLVSNQNDQQSNQSSVNKPIKLYESSEITDIQQASVVDKCNLRQQNEGRSPGFLNEKNKTFNVFSRLGSRSSAGRLCSEAKTSSKSMYLDNRGFSLNNENDEGTGTRLVSKRIGTYNRKRSLTDHQNLDVIKRFKSESSSYNVFHKDYIEKRSDKRVSEKYKSLRPSYDKTTHDLNKHKADYSSTSDERKHYSRTSQYDKKNAHTLRRKFKRH